MLNLLKNHTLALFCIFLIGLFSCNSNETSSNNSDSVDSVNSSVIAESFEYSVPSETIYREKSDDILIDVFYPIGWSKDGLFAYISEPADEATGYYYFTFTIINGNTGNTEWTWKIDEKNAQEEGSLKDTWEKNKNLFASTLEHFKIKQIQDVEIQKFPLNLNSVSYNLKLNVKYAQDTYGFGFDVAGKCSARLSSSTGTDKEIFSKDYQNSMILNISTAGFLKNPYDNHIVILLITTRMGYEGPPNPVSFQTVPAKLEKK